MIDFDIKAKLVKLFKINKLKPNVSQVVSRDKVTVFTQYPYIVNVKSRWKSNNGHLLLAAAKHGLGIAYLPDYYLKKDFISGELVEVIPNWQSINRNVVAIYQERRFLPEKIKRFLQHLDLYIKAHPLIEF